MKLKYTERFHLQEEREDQSQSNKNKMAIVKHLKPIKKSPREPEVLSYTSTKRLVCKAVPRLLVRLCELYS